MIFFVHHVARWLLYRPTVSPLQIWVFYTQTTLFWFRYFFLFFFKYCLCRLPSSENWWRCTMQFAKHNAPVKVDGLIIVWWATHMTSGRKFGVGHHLFYRLKQLVFYMRVGFTRILAATETYPFSFPADMKGVCDLNFFITGPVKPKTGKTPFIHYYSVLLLQSQHFTAQALKKLLSSCVGCSWHRSQPWAEVWTQNYLKWSLKLNSDSASEKKTTCASDSLADFIPLPPPC